MAGTNSVLVWTLVSLAILGRVGYFIDAPLWLDYFKTSNDTTGNASTIGPTNGTTDDDTKSISAFFVLISQATVSVLVFGLWLCWLLVFRPTSITEYDRSYPKKSFVLVGFSQALSSVLFNFSVSGTRTAPFFVLRKRPTCLKLSCAAIVMVAEFVCLIPKIFPELENSKAHADEGGATGLAGALWPLAMVTSMIPFAMANSFMERSVKSEDKAAVTNNPNRLNIIFFLFWFNAFMFLAVVLLWWVDIVPGFGTSDGIEGFGETMWFNLQCLFGQAGCGVDVVMLGWVNYIMVIVGGLSFSYLLRLSEGANFLIVVLTIRTPLLFLFWTLFHEHPFKWHPEATLSTWISLGAIAVMLPAVVIYDRAPPEKDLSVPKTSGTQTDDARGLLAGSVETLDDADTEGGGVRDLYTVNYADEDGSDELDTLVPRT